ncbi:hypothetical protein, partial [Mycoplasma phocimorsus]|uniref:hypothetical protein n=1 Tax=Mycoplasma phocimorsus TaxID=3045839 RepID=UPI0024C0A139
ETESYIFSNVSLNTQNITVYDAIGGLTTSPLEITNLDKFSYYGIYLSLGKTKIDYEKEEVQIEIFYRTKKEKKEKLISVKKSFLDFKSINSNDWSEIFNGIAQLSIIEIYGKNSEGKWKINVKNDYAQASDILISPFEGETPPAEKISYKLTVKNSKKVVGQDTDIKSNKYLSGGRTIKKDWPNVIFRGWNGDYWTRRADSGVISPLEITPTKPGSKFLGWAKDINDTQPNLFINGNNHEEILEEKSIYAVFEFDNPVITVETPDKKKHTLEVKPGKQIYKTDIKEWLQGISKKNNYKWEANLNDALVKNKNTKWKLRFYGDGRAELNPKKGDGFELKIEWIEKPQIVFKGENDDWSFKIPLETGVDFVGEKVLKMPSKKTIEDAIKAKRKKVKRMYWSNNGESYAERAVRKSELSDFSEIWVKVETEDFGTVRVPYKVNLETGEEAYNIIEKTQDGKIKQESLPTKIEIKRKTSWETGHSTNNPVLDKRTKSEKEAGLVLVGWTTKPGGTKPIKFENGESQEAINTEQLYPILKSDGWAEKEKARTAIDWAATVAQAGLTIAEAAAENEQEKHYETAKKAVGIANKLFQIVLGGTIDSNILRDIKDEAASIA